MSAYSDGVRARREGYSRATNPHAGESPYRGQWMRGWHAEDQRMSNEPLCESCRECDEFKEIEKRLEALLLIVGRTGKPNDDFEEIAAAFYRDTGLVRPGKDTSAVYGDTHGADYRREQFDLWVSRKLDIGRGNAPEREP